MKTIDSMKYLEKMRAGEEEVIQSKKNVIRFTRFVRLIGLLSTRDITPRFPSLSFAKMITVYSRSTVSSELITINSLSFSPPLRRPFVVSKSIPIRDRESLNKRHYSRVNTRSFEAIVRAG